VLCTSVFVFFCVFACVRACVLRAVYIEPGRPGAGEAVVRHLLAAQLSLCCRELVAWGHFLGDTRQM